jgi:hypothetical protein
MARRGTGRWVARAAATGGSRSYRGQAPVRWYSSLVLIVVLGVALVAYSRYERWHPSSGNQPTVGSKWYSALSFDVCGKTQPVLQPNPTTKGAQIFTEGDGVVRIEPTSPAYSGNNATLGKFVQLYGGGLRLTSDLLQLPGSKTYRSGSACPAGTPDAAKPAYVQVHMWTSFSGAGSNQAVTVSDPTSLKFSNGQLITVAFVPQGAPIGKPPASTISTLLGLTSGTASTTTTAPPTSSSTTVPSSTSTTS